MSSTKIKFLMSQNDSKDIQRFTLEVGETGEKVNYENLTDLVNSLETYTNFLKRDSRIWILQEDKIIGSLLIDELKSLLKVLDKENVLPSETLAHIIEKELYRKNHELIFVDPRKKTIFTLFGVFAGLLLIVIVLWFVIGFGHRFV